MKILYTNFHPRNGGGHATYVTSLARAYAGDHDISVATPDTSRLFRYVSAIPGVRAIGMRFSTRPSSWFGERAALRRLIAQERYDIIHVNGSADHKQVMLALIGLRHRPRVVFTKHNDHPLQSWGHRLRAALATDHVIAVSDYVRDMLLASPYQRLPITTIRHGIDTDYFAPLAVAGDEASGRLNASADSSVSASERIRALKDQYFGPGWQDCLLFGSAGGTDYDKGWLDLVSAAGTLPPALRSRIRILVAGDLPNDDKRARVKAAGMQDQVVFPGLLDDVRDALACCHVGFVLSYREALSYACREVMSLGLPALVSNAGGLPENVTDGHDGWIVPVRDTAAIAERLRWMLQDPARVAQMGAAARRTAVEQFGLARFAAATLEVYGQALRGN
ncbi:glycosyltransferase [Bordetella sp. 02P26C-1]|uniref:glycosyltransferase n=1 Tax=unclassified Bordetella TaxID=2630031 RepID=UPI001329209C|nr:glycosyltransferase [Bordetella sp. 15P40C-2]MVW80334.1 glycosyltransferase [Bordetella sp. 02P26C-1]